MKPRLSRAEQKLLAINLCRLRLAAVKKSGTKVMTKYRARFLRLYEEAVAKSLKNNGSVKTFASGKRVHASLLWFNDDSTFYGVKVRTIIPDFHLSDAASFKWLTNELNLFGAHWRGRTVVFLPVAYLGLLPTFRKSGFSIDSLILLGDPKRSLYNLMKKNKPSVDLGHLGLDLRQAERKDIPKILRLSKQEFTRNPQFGWFCASRKFLDSQRRELSKDMKHKDHSHYVVMRGKDFLGYFGSDAKKGSPEAGITLLLGDKIQGYGISKTAYRILLSDMVKKKVRAYRGGTGQPAVMHLGKLMGRKMTSLVLRHNPDPFPKGHFNAYLKD